MKEANFKIHVAFALLAGIAGFLLHISVHEWIVVLMCTGFVICMEMLNTAIEQLCNVVKQDIHPVIRIVKDISAGAVMVSAVIAFLCGMVIFLPKFLTLIQTI